MEKKEKIKKRLSTRYFKKEAKDYDEIRLKDFREKDIFAREIEIVRKFLKNSKKGLILDVACGTGRVFPFYENRQIYGVDISKDMLAKAKRRVPTAKTFVGDAEKLPFKSEMFSVVITSRFIMHTPEYEKAIKEMARVVKPGGSLIIDFPNLYSLSFFSTKIKLTLKIGRLKYYNLFTYGQIKKISKKNGLTIKEVESKAFFPPRILPENMHKFTKLLNSLFTRFLPLLSTPMYIRFEKEK